MSKFIVTRGAMRPASNSEHCFYCRQELGEEHLDTCVLINKKVRVRMTIEYDIQVPASWDEFDILSHRNEGSWCADNAAHELVQSIEERRDNDEGCFCNDVVYDYIGNESEAFLNE